ncbi:MAG TPA: protein translocase subunit SecD [Firmicutes bacterium]|nr:protein translocase subunit SecD [Bacillota bacterium]
MRQDLRWRAGIIFIVTIILGLIISPIGAGLFKTDPIRLGLDLKGGVELLLSPDYRVGSNVLLKLGDAFTAKLTQANIAAPQVAPLGVMDGDRYDGLKFTFASAADAQRAMNVGAFPEHYSFEQMGETKNFNLSPTVKVNAVEVRILQDARDFPEDALERSKAIIEHRISEAASGMAEADVRLDGKGRLNVQLPGLKTLQQARDIIVATGRLTFRINDQIVLDGTDMQDIRVSYEAGKGYVINFIFKGEGAKQLEKITTENIGKKMAVYLDESMLMDPVIQDAIPGGSGVITLGSASKDEVEKDALLMKSGALPVSLRVVQSTQVAPTLGKEIVNQSVLAAVIGVAAVVAFMLIFYSLPGLLADFALMIFVVLFLGVMAIFRGVLTLPGIAGFILTVGMAVDANVIIFERIKDEIRSGKRVRPAIHAGFDRALIAIVDSNVTTLIAALVLFFFGTGPVQGFAITLTLGVLISMVSAIFVTRTFLEWKVDNDPDHYTKYFGAKEVPIE